MGNCCLATTYESPKELNVQYAGPEETRLLLEKSSESLAHRVEAETRERCCRAAEAVTNSRFERNHRIYDSFGSFTVSAYNDEIKVAVDYLGYRKTEKWEKFERCRNLGIKLITIPPVLSANSGSIERYIIQKVPNLAHRRTGT